MTDELYQIDLSPDAPEQGARLGRLIQVSQETDRVRLHRRWAGAFVLIMSIPLVISPELRTAAGGVSPSLLLLAWGAGLATTLWLVIRERRCQHRSSRLLAEMNAVRR